MRHICLMGLMPSFADIGALIDREAREGVHTRSGGKSHIGSSCLMCACGSVVLLYLLTILGLILLVLGHSSFAGFPSSPIFLACHT